MTRRCWAATLPMAGPCDGRLVRAHLIPAQLLKREFPHGAICAGDMVDPEASWRRYLPGIEYRPRGVAHPLRPVEAVVWDERAWVWMCGGPTGIGGHHGRLDYSRRLRIPRHRIPPETEEFAAELGLGWWLDRTYGERTEAVDPARIEEDARKARTHEYECGEAREVYPYPRINFERHIDVIEAFLQEYEDDMHTEARGEPFAFASRRHAGEVLAERLGLRR
jgi:hypothetical protein